MTRARLLALPLLIPTLSLLLLAACPTKPPPKPTGCTTPFQGDATQPIQIQLLTINSEGVAGPLGDCGELELVEPPQGGRVVYVGLRATNLDPCSTNIEAALLAPDGSIAGGAGLDIRTVTLEAVAGQPGWVQTSPAGDLTGSGFAAFSNVSVCANTTGIDIQDVPSTLQVILTNREGRKGTKTAKVVARCHDNPDPVKEADCYCLCSANYSQARCPQDFGTTWEDAAMPPLMCGDGGADLATHD